MSWCEAVDSCCVSHRKQVSAFHGGHLNGFEHCMSIQTSWGCCVRYGGCTTSPFHQSEKFCVLKHIQQQRILWETAQALWHQAPSPNVPAPPPHTQGDSEALGWARIPGLQGCVCCGWTDWSWGQDLGPETCSVFPPAPPALFEGKDVVQERVQFTDMSKVTIFGDHLMFSSFSK